MNIRLMRHTHRRTLGQVLRDVWLAVRGETYVTMSACCHTCDKDFLIEVYQDLAFPMTSGGIGIAYANVNDVMYYPTLRARYEDSGAVYEEPNRALYAPRGKRRDWRRPKDAKPVPLIPSTPVESK